MAWAPSKEPERANTGPRPDSVWVSPYPDSQDRWISDFKPYYEMVGEYELDNGEVLYRFEAVADRHHELDPSSPNFHNVVIRHEKKAE